MCAECQLLISRSKIGALELICSAGLGNRYPDFLKDDFRAGIGAFFTFLLLAAFPLQGFRWYRVSVLEQAGTWPVWNGK